MKEYTNQTAHETRTNEKNVAGKVTASVLAAAAIAAFFGRRGVYVGHHHTTREG